MTHEQLELAAYAAAHKIYSLEPDMSLACPSARRSRFVDAIAREIKAVMPEPDFRFENSREYPTLRDARCKAEYSAVEKSEPVRATIQDEANPIIDSLRKTMSDWRRIPHLHDRGGGSGISDRPCLKCGLPDRDPIHRQYVAVEKSEPVRAGNSDEANK